MRFGKSIFATTIGVSALATAASIGSAAIVINEIDSDTPTLPTNDALEFVELFNNSGGAQSLDGLVLVFYNGSNDQSYFAIDLDTFSTNAAGFFTAGNPLVTTAGVNFPANTLQNGADAVALYTGNASDFPNNTPITTANLLDAVVYDTADADDTGLLVLLTAGGQIDEAGAGPSDLNAIGRLPNGAGGLRDTSTWTQTMPTPNAANAAVPEPASAMLLGLGGALLAMRGRRGRSR